MKQAHSNNRPAVFRFLASVVAFCFFGNTALPVQAQSVLDLPKPGTMISMTPAFTPPVLKGMKVDLKDPFAFDFILDPGNSDLSPREVKKEADQLIRYFLASLAIPEDDLWVNLSPYEKDRIIPDAFGQTEMGRDLLAQDYILKQLTASLIYPEGDLGREFWKRVYAKAQAQYGTTDIPVDTFNKVWVVPDKAVVYQHEQTAYVLESHLKVMLEEDYVALSNQKDSAESLSPDKGVAMSHQTMGDGRLTMDENVPRPSSIVPQDEDVNKLGSQIVRAIILPELEKEINSGEQFAKLRQIYSSLILAKWYKTNLRQSILNRAYADQKKIAGVDVEDKTVKEKIYQQYLEAFNKGVFNYIREDIDATTQEMIPRKYFSGGFKMQTPLQIETDPAVLAGVPTETKLAWIRGMYRQPRVSARAVNEYIARKFEEGTVHEGIPITLSDGRKVKTYLIPFLLQNTGQFGHIGLGAKTKDGDQVVYEDENGLPVVYLDSSYADNVTLRENERSKVEQWEAQKLELGLAQEKGRALTAPEMREWIKTNLQEAAALLQRIDQEASQVADLSPLFEQAREQNQLPTNEDIAQTYGQPEDFGDLNLAAGRVVTINDLANVPNQVLQNTSVIFQNTSFFLKRSTHPNIPIQLGAIDALDFLQRKEVPVAQSFDKASLLAQALKSIRDDTRADKRDEIRTISFMVKQGIDIGSENIRALTKLYSSAEYSHDMRAAIVRVLADVLEKGFNIGEDGRVVLLKAASPGENEDVRVAVAKTLVIFAIRQEKPDNEILAALKNLLSDPLSTVRSSVGDAIAEAVIQGGLRVQEMKSLLNESLKEEDVWQLTDAAAQTIEKILQKGGEVGSYEIGAFKQAFESESGSVRAAVVKALGVVLSKIESKNADVFDVLINALEDDLWNVRELSALALGDAIVANQKIGVDVLKDVLSLKDHPNFVVRIAIAQALGRASEKGLNISREALDVLFQLLDDNIISVREASADALGKIIKQGQKIELGEIEKLTNLLKTTNGSLKAVVTRSLGEAIKAGIVIGDKNIGLLIRAAQNDDEQESFRIAAITALGYAVKGGLKTEQDGLLVLIDLFSDHLELGGVREAAAQTLGYLITNNIEIGEAGVRALEQAVTGSFPSVRVASAKALAGILKQGRGLGLQARAALVEMIKSENPNEHVVAIEALSFLIDTVGGDVQDILEAVKKAINNSNPQIRENLVRSLGYSAPAVISVGRTESNNLIIEALHDENKNVVNAAVQTLGQTYINNENGDESGFFALIEALGYRDEGVRVAVQNFVNKLIEQGKFAMLSIDDIESYHLLLKKERTDPNGLSNPEVNGKRAYIIKIYAGVKGKADSQDISFAGRVLAETHELDYWTPVLEMMSFLSMNGSSDAQSFLEGKVGQIVARRPKSGQDFVTIDERDILLIEAVIKSFSQRSLLPILVDAKFSVDLRIRVLRALAENRYIDSNYNQLSDSSLSKYLDAISQIFTEYKLVPTKVTVENFISLGNVTEKIKAKKPFLDSLVSKKDYRILIKELADDEDLMFVYYMLYQSPFQYQGIDPMSFERFKALVHDAAKKLKFENVDVVTTKLVEGFINSGLPEDQAREIADSVLRGKPPLPRNSPYLDENGDFIPQKVEVLARLTDAQALDQIQDSFNSSLRGIVNVLKINELLRRIPPGIEKRFKHDPNQRLQLLDEYDRLIAEIRLGVDWIRVFSQVTSLNDKVFPPEGRKRDIKMQIAQSVNTQIRNTPFNQFFAGLVRKQLNEDGRIDLENLDINSLIRNADAMVNVLKAKKESGKLTETEKSIIGDQEIQVQHVIKIFFTEMRKRLGITDDAISFPIFQDLETQLLAAFDGFMEKVSRRINLFEVPQVVYVDFISKFNLFEFFRFSDGAHCCLASDPTIAGRYGANVYDTEMPRYLTNATSFWWQLTTAPRDGKQIGWYENWFALDENRKIIVGTELTYMSPSYHSRDLQAAVLETVEKILFSTKVTKVAQAGWGVVLVNALTSPASYKPEVLNLAKLQSLNDGVAIYEDAPLETNVFVERQFNVKSNPGIDLPSAILESQDYNVGINFMTSEDITEHLIDEFRIIEKQTFPEYKQEDDEYMRLHLKNPKVVVLVLKDEDSGEIVGYLHAVPGSSEGLKALEGSKYAHYRSGKVLYVTDIALLPKYWGKIGMGKKFQAFFDKAKKLGYEFITLHTETTTGVRPGASLSQKFQQMGSKVILQEEDWGETGETYDFLVLDLLRKNADPLPVDDETLAKGGIDFNLDLLELEIQGGDADFNLPEGIQNLENIHIDQGLLPVITQISPITNLPAILGAVKNEEPFLAKRGS